MKVTEPLKTQQQIDLVKNYLYYKNRRDHLLFCVGINSALRISDLLRLKISDVWDGKQVKQYIEINEQKTGKLKKFPIGKKLDKIIRDYIKQERAGAAQDEPLFANQRGNKAISRQYAHKVLSDAVDFCGLDIRYGTHGLRKTWAYSAYRQTGNLDMISLALNHNSLAETRRYICLEQEELNAFYLSVDV